MSGISPELQQAAQVIGDIRHEVSRRIELPYEDLTFAVGAVVLNRHMIGEGDPGTGKTDLAKAIATAAGGSFGRSQGTPDLMPKDIIGYERLIDGELEFVPGPFFSNVYLFDEMNRATTKAQSGVLEGMQEGQVTVGGENHKLPRRHTVLATHNPLADGEGVMPIPEAGLDRFAFSLSMEPHSTDDMLAIDTLMERDYRVTEVASLDEVEAAGNAITKVEVPNSIKRGIAETVVTLRELAQRKGSDLDRERTILSGQRAFYFTKLGAQLVAVAMNEGSNERAVKTIVTPRDVSLAAQYVLPHRLALSYKAEQAAESNGETIRERKEALVNGVVDRVFAGIGRVSR